ncbi:MAG: hypothetical protein ABR549_14675 [Mycobacteriales bacterium]
MTTRIAVLALLLTAACGSAGTGGQTSVGSAPAPTTRASTPAPTRTPAPIPSFSTPQAAMRYLASAWNRGDLTELKHVTDPSARQQLLDMHREATDLRLEKCVRLEAGDYDCTFSHAFPIGYPHHRPRGKAGFLVGPARRSGWYMTVYEYCGG